MLSLAILTGSVRPGRFNIQPATWLYDLAKERDDATFELIDLQEINLPFLDEPAPPSRQQYSKEHTKQWSARIAPKDGFVFVTPEYNHSISPVLKNAIDFLFVEWHYKPVTYVGYGSAGGVRSIEHLRAVAAEVKMYDLREQLLLPEPWNNLDSNGKFQFTDEHTERASGMLDALVFWAEVMRAAREKLEGQ